MLHYTYFFSKFICDMRGGVWGGNSRKPGHASSILSPVQLSYWPAEGQKGKVPPFGSSDLRLWSILHLFNAWRYITGFLLITYPYQDKSEKETWEDEGSLWWSWASSKRRLPCPICVQTQWY